jgi:poly-gamma-glutamate synthase PgsB/CapB
MSIFLVAALATLVFAGLFEYRNHSKRLDTIPIRICVNGTRGKSSVTRLIAAALRASGKKTFAKTTGSAAMLIYPDGSEHPIKRRGEARIIEQIPILKTAHALGAQALVVECMALAPENQAIFETKLTRSTLSIITNVRSDHKDLMGTSLEETAIALSSTIPWDGILILGPTEAKIQLESVCAARRTKLIYVEPTDQDELEARLFGAHFFAENLAIALAACSIYGLKREDALQAMLESRPDPGVKPMYRFALGGVGYAVVDALAANDFESTEMIWKRNGEIARKEFDRFVVIVNHRIDRPWRVTDMSSLISQIEPDKVFFIGELSRLAMRASGGRFQAESMSGCTPGRILERTREGIGTGAEILLFLCGNVKGEGMALASYIETVGATL